MDAETFRLIQDEYLQGRRLLPHQLGRIVFTFEWLAFQHPSKAPFWLKHAKVAQRELEAERRFLNRRRKRKRS